MLGRFPFLKYSNVFQLFFLQVLLSPSTKNRMNFCAIAVFFIKIDSNMYIVSETWLRSDLQGMTRCCFFVSNEVEYYVVYRVRHEDAATLSCCFFIFLNRRFMNGRKTSLYFGFGRGTARLIKSSVSLNGTNSMK